MTPSEYETMLHILQALVWGICILTTAFPFIYAIWSNWRATRAGIAVMVLMSCLAATWDVTLLFSYWESASIPTVFWVSGILYSSVLLATGYLMYALLYNQHLDRKEKRERQRT